MMFYGRMKDYKIESPQEIKDKYNHIRYNYIDEGTAFIYITEQDRTMINVNDLDLLKATYVAYTQNDLISEGWRIDNKYLVKSRIKAPRGQVILYLQAIEDGK